MGQKNKKTDIITWDGEKRTHKEWAEYLGITVSQFKKRVRNYYFNELTREACFTKGTVSLAPDKPRVAL